jgi:hypothetical protein
MSADSGRRAGELPFADELGPAKTIHVQEKSIGHAWRVR